MSGKKVRLYIEHLNKEMELDVIDGADGPSVIDITKLYTETGMFTYDPAFMSTASCSSAITYIDGEKGILRHRGYNIASLAEQNDFMDVTHLLLYGELPTPQQKEEFIYQIKHHTMVHEQIHFLYRGFPRSSHPMAVMVGAVGSLSAFYHDNFELEIAEQRNAAALKLIAKVPTLAAMTYKYSVGQPFVHPDNS